MTFGETMRAARIRQGISQKDLAAAILRQDGSGPLSAQYLNDIEHDRRTPTADWLIVAIAEACGEDEGLMFVLAGKIPDDIRDFRCGPEAAVAAFKAFRKAMAAAPRRRKRQ